MLLLNTKKAYKIPKLHKKTPEGKKASALAEALRRS